MKNNIVSDKIEFRTIFLLSIWSFLVLLLCSPDSYLYDMYLRGDSAVFFICGKAWMNGLVPYIDFADSKGPLLWLIYGLGYLIDNDSYVGVFWMTIPFLIITLYYGCKIAMLYLENTSLSLIASVLLTFALFHPSYHIETRAETFCWSFLACSIFQTLKLQKVPLTQRQRFLSFILLGICFSCTLLIKFTMAAMVGGCTFIAWICEDSLKKKYLGLSYFCIGALVLLTPFVFYFVIEGNLYAFVDEYFLTTIRTVDSGIGGFGQDIKRGSSHNSVDLLMEKPYYCKVCF